MKIKKNLIIILALTIILMPSSLSFGEDINGHWAYEATSDLINKQIISGDESGNYNLENNITRAEFVKIINKSFGYYLSSTDGFSDISSEDWYYSEFLIAKKAGYIKGDDKGNANPVMEIMRSEACVILARIMKLDTQNTINNFSDDDIPNWAIGSVNALRNVSIISGNEDGSFRGIAPIKRAEAFQMVYVSSKKYIEKATDEIKTSVNTSGMESVIKTPSRTASGGGSSGQSSGSGKLKAPQIVRYNPESETLIIDTVTNAKYYRIKFAINNSAFYLETDNALEREISLGSKLYEITKDIEETSIEFDISIMSVAKTGYQNSDYSAEIHTIKYFEAIDSPNLTVRTAKAGGIKHSIISWSQVEGASEYKVSAKIDNTDFISYRYDADKCEIRIQDLSALGDDDVNFYVQAISEDRTKKRHSKISEIIVSNNPENKYDSEGYYLVSDSEDFVYAVKNVSKIKLERNITLGADEMGKYWIPLNFSGELNGNNKMITVYFNGTASAAAPAGIFANISGGVKIYNLKINGNVKTTGGYNGALAGNLGQTTGSSLIENCINYATVSSTSGSYTGGLIGNMSAWSYLGKLRGLVNLGEVSGSAYVGGVIGLNKSYIEYSSNFGNVTATGWYAGGIIGRNHSTATILGCYNKGIIKSMALSAGGIVGTATDGGTTTITNCYNIGSIVGTATEVSGGILGRGDYNTFIKNCFNLGSVVCKKGDPSPIYPSSIFITASSCYYLSESLENDGKDNTEPLTQSDFANKSHQGVSSLINAGYEFLDGFSYPQISGNNERSITDFRIYEGVSGISSVLNGKALTFCWVNPLASDIEKIVISINDNSNILRIIDNKELLATDELFELNNIELGNYYEIYITVSYENGNVSETYNYEMKAE